MPNFVKNLRLNIKIALLGSGSVLTTVAALVILAVWQSGAYNRLAQKEVDQLIDADLDHITQGIYNLVSTEDEAVQDQVNYDLNVARHILANKGKISLSNEIIRWTAINQFTNKSTQIQTPKMLVGDQWLGINNNPKIETAIVDEISELVGESATIFQRMNKNGNMIRIATTITTSENKRAISTYIPAINPDGTPNPVIANVLKGKTYLGRAYVVNAWYLTAYEPIKDFSGKIVGMLYVGVKQKTVESRIRQAILQTKVGKTGYVYVLGSKNVDRGRYIISQRGERDGENIWESKDRDGQYVVQAIINKAIKLHPGEQTTIRYRWQNPGESEPRWKVARLAYYEPWDWVIGASVYEDELQTYREVLSSGRTKMTNIMGLAGLAITIIVGFMGILIAWTIARPLRQITTAAEIITQGNLDQVIDVYSRDEIGTLAKTFNFMTQQLKQTIEGLHKSEGFLNNIVENIPDMIFVKDAEELRFVRLNKAGEELLGYTSDELIGKNDYDFFPRNEADIFITEDKEVLNSRRLLDIKEERIHTKLFGARILHTKKIPLLDGNGKPQYLLGISEDITERKKAEEALASERSQILSIFDSIEEIIYVTDLNTYEVLYANTAMKKVFQKELIGGLCYREFHGNESPCEFCTNEIIMRQKPKSYRWEFHNKKIDTHLSIIDRIIKWPDGRDVRFELAIDITEHKKAEEALLSSEERFREIANKVPGVVYQFFAKDNGEWGLNFVSERSEGIFGIKAEPIETYFNRFFDCVVEEDKERFITSIKEAVSSVRNWEFEGKLITPTTKEEKYVKGTSQPKRQKEEIVFNGIFLDITQRMQSEDALQQSEKKYRLLFENSPLGIFLINQKGKIISLNSAGPQILGFPSLETAKAINILTFPFLVKSGFPAKVVECFENGKQSIFEFPYTSKWGKTVYLRCYLTPIFDENKKVDKIQMLLEDFTEKKKTEEELQKHRDHLEDLVYQRTQELEEVHKELVKKERLATLGQLTAIVSHELRNPLGTIRNSIYEMNERLRGKNSGLEKALDRAERNIIRCDKIIEELLDYTRETENIMAPFLIDEWISNFLDEAVITEKIKLVKKLNAGVEVNINPESFRRCLINLIDNAVQAMTETEKEIKSKKQSSLSNLLSIETRIEEDNLIINIKDSGPGMSKDELKKIFEPLYSTKGFGVGLGLPIVKKIIEQHNGGIEIISKKGEGTIAVLRLPVIKNNKE